MKFRPSIAAAVTALLLSGCPEQKSERVLLVEAATLAQDGNLEQAGLIFEQVYQRNPQNPDVLLRYAEFAIGLGNMERANAFINTLDSLEVRGTDLGRLQNLKRHYFQRIYDESRGNAPAAPADVEAYEHGVIGLINLERAGPLLDEYNLYLLMQARALLGRSPEQPIAEELEEAVAAASPEQATAALVFLDRLVDGDERSDVVRPLEGSLNEEATGLQAALRVALFRHQFDQRWNTRYRDAFVRDDRFDAATQTFRTSYEGPAREDVDATATAERLAYIAQTWHAREVATDLAYELSGESRDGAEPLPYDVADFASTEATEVRLAEDLTFRFRLAIPMDTVRHGAWLLHQRLHAPPEPGSGDAAPDADEAATPE